MVKILIAYTSIGGNTELVVQKVTEILTQRFEVNTARVDVLTANSLEEYNCIILASPTYGQGTVEDHMSKYLKLIKSSTSGKSFAIIGLGDNKYYPEYLSESGAILEKFVTDNGGNLLIPALRIGMPPIKFIEKLVPRWCEILTQKLI
jgi:flavodoxin I